MAAQVNKFNKLINIKGGISVSFRSGEDCNYKKIQRMHDAERDGALMCAALLMISMVVMVIFMVYWLIV